MSYFWGSGKDDKSSSRSKKGQSNQRQGHQESRMEVDDYGSRSPPKHHNTWHYAGNPSYANTEFHGDSRSQQRYSQQYGNPYDVHMDHHGYQGHVGQQGHQMMIQEQSFRSKQASKQMVYEVFGNVISILEEFENREMAKEKPKEGLPKSKIKIPDQSYKKDSDIQRILETQLLIFQTHLHSACRPEVRNEVTGEMIEAVKQWVAVRKDKHLRHGKTDEYAANLYEILTRGRTQHPAVFTEKPDIGEQELQKAAHQYFEGDFKRSQLDARFANDPAKKALMPSIRIGSSPDTGIDRIAEHRPDLVDHPQSIL